jgi:hypothetical protein
MAVLTDRKDSGNAVGGGVVTLLTGLVALGGSC